MEIEELKDIKAMLYRYKKSRLQALLNNCVDDDEAILYKREVEGLEEVNTNG